MKVRQTFYVSLRNRFGFGFAAFYLVLILAASPNTGLMVALAIKGVFVLAIAIAVCTVSVTDQGITLNRVNKAEWSAIEGITLRSLLGMPYLLLHRSRGWKWWLPLYLQDVSGFKAAVISKAPAGHPVRIYAESQSNI